MTCLGWNPVEIIERRQGKGVIIEFQSSYANVRVVSTNSIWKIDNWNV